MISTLLWISFTYYACYFVSANESDKRCSTCRVAVKEIIRAITTEDLDKTMEVGSFRIDEKGNMNRKKVPYTRSEAQLDEILENLCELRTYKYGMKVENGRYGFVQVDSLDERPLDMTKVEKSPSITNWLRYSCESLVDDFEEEIKSVFMKNESNPEQRLCMDIAKVCTDEQLKLVFKIPFKEVPKSETSDASKDVPLDENRNQKPDAPPKPDAETISTPKTDL